MASKEILLTAGEKKAVGALSGFNPAQHEAGKFGNSLWTAVGPVADQIKKTVGTIEKEMKGKANGGPSGKDEMATLLTQLANLRSEQLYTVMVALDGQQLPLPELILKMNKAAGNGNGDQALAKAKEAFEGKLEIAKPFPFGGLGISHSETTDGHPLYWQD